MSTNSTISSIYLRILLKQQNTCRLLEITYVTSVPCQTMWQSPGVVYVMRYYMPWLEQSMSDACARNFDFLKRPLIYQQRRQKYASKMTFRWLKGIFWAMAKCDHEIYINYLADEAQYRLQYNNLHPACRAIVPG